MLFPQVDRRVRALRVREPVAGVRRLGAAAPEGGPRQLPPLQIRTPSDRLLLQLELSRQTYS